jgi:hypothetical protein
LIAIVHYNITPWIRSITEIEREIGDPGMKSRKLTTSLLIALLIGSNAAMAETGSSSYSSNASSKGSKIVEFFYGLFHHRRQPAPSSEQTGDQTGQAGQIDPENPQPSPSIPATQPDSSIDALNPPALRWEKRADARPVFKAGEKFDSQNPESFNRIVDAIREDEEANNLVLGVLRESGKSDLSEIITFKEPKLGFQSGTSRVTIQGDAPQAVLHGWPSIAQDGTLLLDTQPGSRLKIEVTINSKLEMIETYSTIIHEFTHVRGQLKKLKTRNLLDVLDYDNASSYAMEKIDGDGGEVDAFVAEISAVIRYRNRYHLPYESFHTPITERFFNDQSGALNDREGLKQRLMFSGGGAGYFNTYKEEFRTLVQTYLQYSESLRDNLKQDPNYQLNPAVREEAERLATRALKIRAKFVQ